MANLTGFDANHVEPRTNFDPLPAGKYLVAITESEMKPTKAGTGNFLQLTFQVLDGPHKGRLFWARLNLDNPNTTAVQIARAELSAICRAIGVMAPKDSVELHNLPLVICTPDHFLNHVCYEVGVRELIVQGYLSPLVSKAGINKADFGGLHVRAGEFVADEVESLMDDDRLVAAACGETVAYTGNSAKAWYLLAGTAKKISNLQMDKLEAALTNPDLEKILEETVPRPSASQTPPPPPSPSTASSAKSPDNSESIPDLGASGS